MRTTWKDFMAELQRETAARGPAAIAESNILRAHYEFANRVYQARKQRKWSQQALARASGIDQAEISRIERGESNPTMATMVRVLGALGLKVHFPDRPTGTAALRPGAPRFRRGRRK